MKHLLLYIAALVFVVIGIYIGSRMIDFQQAQVPSRTSPLLEEIKKGVGARAAKPLTIPDFDKPITLPKGFHMYVYAKVPNARSMALGDDGTVYVGNKSGTSVYALPDKNSDGVADRLVTIVSGLMQPNGIAVKDGALFVADNTSVLRFDNISENFDNPSSEVIFDDFIGVAHHQWKYAAFGPDGKLYIALGAPCDSCKAEHPYGSIARMNSDGTGLEVVARGIRNSVGFDWQPKTGELWFTDNGRDNMGDDVPPDELNRVTRAGQDFGFPYCYGTDVPDPIFGSEKPCTTFTAPVKDLDPHAAALGMKFYRGSMFPAEYRDAIFIAQHGSWNRSEKIGYRVLVLKPDGDSYRIEPFAEGWLRPDGSVIGRPVDILELKDGSILISDDAEGLIYRVVYTG